MNVNGIYGGLGAADRLNSGAMPPPAASDVQAFNKGMSGSDTDQVKGMSDTDVSGGTDAGANKGMPSEQMMQLLMKLLEQMIKMLEGMNNEASKDAGEQGSQSAGDQGMSKGGSTPNGEGGGVKPVEGSGAGGSAGSDNLIPKPTEHVQQLNLGGKQVTVGGDGSASASEVEATAGSINNLYENSPTFRNMVDSSSDPAFEVSVGRRDDNTSWGNSDGRVFMNINNMQPGNSDSFQSLLAHEFGHASIDIGHGGQMEQLERAVAQEA